MNMKFIKKSVSLIARVGVAVHPGRPLGLLMRRSETHTHRHTHAAFITYKSKACNLSVRLSFNECQCCV